MPTTTWRAMRREIMDAFGSVQFSTTTDIAGSSTDIISTELSNRFNQADVFNGQWFYTIIVDDDDGSSTPANGLGTTVRRVSNYAESTGTLTGVGVNIATEDETVQVDLYQHFHPDDILRAYNRARTYVWPFIGQVRDIETLVTGPRQIAYTVPSTIRRINRLELGERYEAGSLAENLLLNGAFSNWSGDTSPDDWTIAGAGASVNRERETTNPTNYLVLSRADSARVVVPSTTVTTLLQTFDSASSDYVAVGTEGVECNTTAWVYCTTASVVSVRIAGNDGTAHSGTGWEFLKHSQNLGPTATTVAVGVVGASNSAAYPFFVDEVIMALGPSEPIERPYTAIVDWKHTPPVNGASNGGILRFGEFIPRQRSRRTGTNTFANVSTDSLPSQHRIRIIGTDILSSIALDTDTVEVDGDLLRPLYDKTRQLMCDGKAMGDIESDWWRMARKFEADYEDAIEDGVGIRPQTHRFKAPAGV